MHPSPPYRDAASEDGCSDSEDSSVSPKDDPSEVQGAPIEKVLPMNIC